MLLYLHSSLFFKSYITTLSKLVIQLVHLINRYLCSSAPQNRHCTYTQCLHKVIVVGHQRVDSSECVSRFKSPSSCCVPLLYTSQWHSRLEAFPCARNIRFNVGARCFENAKLPRRRTLALIKVALLRAASLASFYIQHSTCLLSSRLSKNISLSCNDTVRSMI